MGKGEREDERGIERMGKGGGIRKRRSETEKKRREGKEEKG